jgi:uncharacterized protein YacL
MQSSILIVAFSLVGSTVGTVVLSDALHQALLNDRTMVKDGTAMQWWIALMK